MMWDWYGPGAGWGGWAMMLLMIVFTVAAIVAGVFLVRFVLQQQAPQQPVVRQAPHAAIPKATPESPQEILKRRYAAGEIDRDEYLQKLGDLSGE